MRHERLVLDTSVLISAALQPQGKPAATLKFSFEHSSLIFSKETFAEIASRLMRAKFDKAVTPGDERSTKLTRDAKCQSQR